jgi:hypothetical protein
LARSTRTQRGATGHIDVFFRFETSVIDLIWNVFKEGAPQSGSFSQAQAESDFFARLTPHLEKLELVAGGFVMPPG